MGSTTGGACHIGKKSREGKGDEVKVGSLKMASFIFSPRRKFDPEDKGVIDWKDRSDHLLSNVNIF